MVFNVGGKCPWYKDGICYSPKTLREYQEPSSKPVNVEKCLTDKYTSCTYYSEPRKDETLLPTQVAGLKEKKMTLYLPILTVTPNLRSDCPFYQLEPIVDENGNTVYIAYCRATKRYLTKSHASKCTLLWRDCPFYLASIK